MKKTLKCSNCKSTNVETLYSKKELRKWNNSRLTAGLTASTNNAIIKAIISGVVWLVKLLFKRWMDSEEEKYTVCNDCGYMDD